MLFSCLTVAVAHLAGCGVVGHLEVLLSRREIRAVVLEISAAAKVPPWSFPLNSVRRKKAVRVLFAVSESCQSKFKECVQRVLLALLSRDEVRSLGSRVKPACRGESAWPGACRNWWSSYHFQGALLRLHSTSLLVNCYCTLLAFQRVFSCLRRFCTRWDSRLPSLH